MCLEKSVIDLSYSPNSDRFPMSDRQSHLCDLRAMRHPGGPGRGHVDRDVAARTIRYLDFSLPQPVPLSPAVQRHRHTEPMWLMLRHRNNDAM
jgi:hypothetical protein